jgi:hypothetical protein
MPLVVFSGVGGNGNNLIFGIGLINNETTSSYQWIFKNFIRLIGAKPVTLLTDSDLSIIEAIKVELPETKHLLCQWHIKRNIEKNLGYL